MEEKRLRIGVQIGSFNPIHYGHIRMLEHSLSKLDKVIIVPASNPYGKTDMAELDHRLIMVWKGIEDIIHPVLRTNIIISDIDKRVGGYTSDVLEELQKEYPNSELVLIIGEDLYEGLYNFHKAEWILENFEVMVFSRLYKKLDENKSYNSIFSSLVKKKITFITGWGGKNISSTMIREIIKQHKDLNDGSDLLFKLAYYTSASVSSYIERNGLYGL